MTNIRIFDDQYGWKIYRKLNALLPEYNYPVKEDVFSPIPFIDRIKDWDIILLDNYFPWARREEPVWDTFLQLYLEKWLTCKIIWISDYWKVLLDKYMNWDLTNKKWDIIGRVTSKDAEDVAKFFSWK